MHTAWLENMGSVFSGNEQNNQSPSEVAQHHPITFPLDIPVVTQMEFIITHWLRNHGQKFPMEITELIVNSFIYQPLFAIEHDYKLKHSDKYGEELALLRTKGVKEPKRKPSQQIDYDYLVRLIVVGNHRVGKGSLLRRYKEDIFHEFYIDNIGVDFTIKHTIIDGVKMKLQLWDAAGADRYRISERAYYRGASGFIMVYDVTDKSSFDEMKPRNGRCSEYASELRNRILIGNKIDDLQNRVIPKEEGQQLAIDLGIEDHTETSAKTGENVQRAIDTLALRILSRIRRATTPWIG